MLVLGLLCLTVDEQEFQNLPDITPKETLAVAVSEKPLAVSFFATDKGREMLRRAYFSCAHTNQELAEIFNCEPAHIQAFVSKQGWPAERERSRKDGELAAERARLRQKVTEAQWAILEVATKGIEHLRDPDIDGEGVLASAKNFRALAQTINELSPKDEEKKTQNSLINIGSQVTLIEE